MAYGAKVKKAIVDYRKEKLDVTGLTGIEAWCDTAESVERVLPRMNDQIDKIKIMLQDPKKIDPDAVQSFKKNVVAFQKLWAVVDKKIDGYIAAMHAIAMKDKRAASSKSLDTAQNQIELLLRIRGHKLLDKDIEVKLKKWAAVGETKQRKENDATLGALETEFDEAQAEYTRLDNLLKVADKRRNAARVALDKKKKELKVEDPYALV